MLLVNSCQLVIRFIILKDILFSLFPSSIILNTTIDFDDDNHDEEDAQTNCVIILNINCYEGRRVCKNYLKDLD
jgi:hypothetical protein